MKHHHPGSRQAPRPCDLRVLASAAAALFAVGAAPFATAQTRPPVVFASKLPTPAFQLPQPFTSLMRDPAQRGFATPVAGSGAVTWSVDGKTATLNQGSVDRVLLNWQSFDIAEGYTVRFIQDKDPARLVSALNRVWSDRPSVIQGSLVADREVIVQNPLGVHFGGSARVTAGKLVATTLGVSDAVFAKGVRNVTDATPVFTTAGTDHKPTDLNSSVTVEAGAVITTAAGGDVLLVAPRVVNQGRIETPQGQTVLAAGDKVYLMSSSDPAQRGLIVAVDAIQSAAGSAPDTELGIAENSAASSTDALVRQLNQIRADSGSVNLVGLTLRQNGNVNATSAVKGANGAVYLQSMASTTALASDGADGAGKRGLVIEAGASVRVAAELGTVSFGAGSVTSVTPDASSATQLDAEQFTRSSIRAEGRAISVGAGAQLRAPSGSIALLASRSAVGDSLFETASGVGRADGSSIVIAPGARLDVAGLRDVPVDGARNQGSLRLFRIELADAPLQREGPLYRSAVLFDLRDASKVSVANVTANAAAIGRTAAERSTAGGSIRMQTHGALVVGADALLDVSGGSMAYSPANLQSSLLTQDGRVVTFRSAAAGSRVEALLPATQTTRDPGYTEGVDGGTLVLGGQQVALAGGIAGGVVQGERQRDGRSAAALPSRLLIGRRDGSSYDLPEIRLRPAWTAAQVAIGASIFANPLQPLVWPQAGSAALAEGLDLSLDKIATSGFGSLSLRASRLVQPIFGALNLGLGGSFEIESRTVALDGSFVLPGGKVSVTTPTAEGNADLTGDGDIRISARTQLDTAGLWSNETAATKSEGDLARQLSGGSVVLRSAHSLRVDAGAVIDVSGGARLHAAGSLSTGKAGAVTLSIGTGNPLASPQLAIDGVTLRAFDFAQGGRLTLGTPALTIGGAAAGGFHLEPAFFARSGFGTIGIAAQGDIALRSGSLLAPRLLNWQLGEDFRGAPSGRMANAATPQRVDAALADAQPVNLNLAATRALEFGGAGVSVERGAAIELDAGAQLNLSATRSIDVGVRGGAAQQASMLTARGGAMQLSITGNRGSDSGQDLDGFIAEQAIRLGAEARLSVDGIARMRRDGSGTPPVQFGTAGDIATPRDERRVGSVLGGGSITLDAARGYVVAEAGSRLSLDGASAVLNFAGLAAAVPVAKAGGTLTVSTPEGFALDGAVSAQAPRDAAGRALADGGRLNLSLGAGGVLTTTLNADHPYSTAPRVVAVSNTPAATTGGPVNGLAVVRPALLQGAGFDAINLAAGDAVRFDTSLALDAPLGLQINAPAIAAVPGAQVSLKAGHALLGDATNVRRGALPDTAARADMSVAQDTRLSVAAPVIEWVGNVGLQGFSTVTLDASKAGEIRVGAVDAKFNSLESLRRELRFAGTLRMNAGQAYATSASRYSLSGLAGSRVEISGGDATKPPPLSAFGALSISADDIDQRGNLHQPFGQIALRAARTLTLGEGSHTTVSGDGAAVLYGQTLNLSQWVLPGQFDSFFSLAQNKGITLNAAQIVTARSATVDASGGGAVWASEFFPGVGGSRDYFHTAGLFAVLPDYAATRSLSASGGFALNAASGQPTASEFVVTLPGSGLQPGRYAVLPASYALLAGALPKGAFLVSRATDPGKNLLRAPLAQDDGSVVVTGYLGAAGSATAGTPGERFVVESAATFGAKSDVRLSDVSSLLVQRAAGNGDGRPAVPRDGGLLQVIAAAGSSGNLPGSWLARTELAARGGTAGELDVAAPKIALVDEASKAPASAFAVEAGVLAASGAGSVLLGGTRSLVAGSDTAAADGSATWSLDASASQSVTVALGGTELKLGEVLLASHQRVELAAGTRISAAQAADAVSVPRRWRVAGDGALVVVSTQPVGWQRSAVALTGGELLIGAGSVLSGAQVGLDATGQARIDPSVRLPAQALTLGARRIAVGAGAPPDDAAASPDTTALTGALLSTVRGAALLQLRSYSSIDFVGQQDWAADAASVRQQRLVLDAPNLRGVATASGEVPRTAIVADEIVLQNSSGLPAALAPGQGSLLLRASPPLRYGRTGGLTLGTGAVALGFDDATLRSAGDIVLAGSSAPGGSSLQAQNTLTLSAARVTAATGADHAVVAGGTLAIGVEAGSRTLGERAGAGANVRLQGARVLQDGVVDLPGGRIDIVASGGSASDAAIRFGAGSSTSVAGFALEGPDGFAAFATAGAIRAQAAFGRIDVFGTLDASAARRADGSAGEGDAGSLTLRAFGAGGALQLSADAAAAPSGRLLGQAGAAAGDRGGSLTVEVSGMPSADALARAATVGGFTRELSLRVAGGDVALDSAVTAQRIDLAADGGRLAIGSHSAALRLDASSAGGGVVQLAAAGDLAVAAAVQIDARSSGPGAGGGDVLLASGDGRVRVAPGAQIDARGSSAAGGRIVLRAARDASGTGVAIDALDARHLLAAEVALEGVRFYDGIDTLRAAGSAAPGVLIQATLRADNAASMATRSATLAALGVTAADVASRRVNLRAGVEVRSAGDLTLDGDWSFGGSAAQPNLDRPGGDGGWLTLRAAGSVRFKGSLSDGFVSAAPTAALRSDLHAWSYRIAAGADLSAANPLALQAAAASGGGDIVIGAGQTLRTGAGSIELAASRDVLFSASDSGGAAGSVLVSGRPLGNLAALHSTLFAGQVAKPLLTEGGGRLTVSAQRDIVAPEATQFIANWFWRSGTLGTRADEAGQYSANSQLAWWSEPGRFQQSLGSFGGGAIDVRAGRDIVNLQAMAPSAGWADRRDADSALIERRGGGDLGVSAGRDLLGGQYFVGRGAGRLQAGRSVDVADGNQIVQEPALAAMDGAWRVSARSGVVVSAPFNPTATAASAADNRPGRSGFFYTFGEGASLGVVANAGRINLRSGFSENQAAAFGLEASGGLANAFQVLPPSLVLTAGLGGIDILSGAGQSTAVLYPSPQGRLAWWSGANLRVGEGATGQLAMSDSSPADFPQTASPTRIDQNPITDLQTGLFGATLADRLPLTGLHAADTRPARVHAEGDVRIDGKSPLYKTLLVPVPALISAGQDVVDLSLRAQHFSADDTTRITAARNLVGGLSGGIELAGPGTLDASAGRNVDLGASAGMTTSGNQRNPRLPAQGAAIRLAAATAGQLDIDVLVARYLDPADAAGGAQAQAHRALLLATVRAELRAPDLGYEQALAAFKSFPAAAQAAFGRQVLATAFAQQYLSGPTPDAAALRLSLQAAFERRKAEVLAAGDAALAAGTALVLPGREALSGDALAAYLAALRPLAFSSLELDSTLAQRAASLAQLATLRGLPRDEFRQRVLASEAASAGAAAAHFGRLSLPMRLALFDQGFEAAELAGAGSFVATPVWPGAAPLMRYAGALDMTQSSVVTQRGGGISVVNAGGAINVGLKDTSGASSGAGAAKGVIALGGGDIFGFARDDFQVNTQRVFIVGSGNMTIWSSSGDIDSGRGANTAVAAPPLAARRSADGVVFEVPATTTGSGLGILADAQGRRSGTIGLYPAFGEILALDAFIRAPAVVLGSAVRGADNLIAASVGGAAAVVAPPAVSVAPPAASTDNKTAVGAAAGLATEARPRSALLTVELLGLGSDEAEPCDDKRRQDGKCRQPLR